MHIKIPEIDIIIGKLNSNIPPFSIFDSKVVDFFDELSKFIISDLNSRNFSDLVTFGFWCRKSNIKKISSSYKLDNSMGRGTVLHITPSNIPMNFAYSFAFGMLSGNYNIVRLPMKKFKQISLLCEIISKLCRKNKFKEILKKFCFVSYFKSNNISEQLSYYADARLIWGGDQTIESFKKYYTSPRCIDLNFSDRHSLSLINVLGLKKLNKKQFSNFVKKFFNDAFLMDQQACSSPQAIIWLYSKKSKLIIEKFWTELTSTVSKSYFTDLSTTNFKYLTLTDLAISSKINFKRKNSNFDIVRLNAKNIRNSLDDIKCNFGTFIEININHIKEIKNFVSKKTQTLSCFGYDSKKIKKLVISQGFKGIDRIVPIGRANDMGHIWDGYDIISTLSRKISE